MHPDPLVLPISVDGGNGNIFLESTRQVSRRFEGVRPTGGLSNVSFGMPARRLLNITFARLAAEHGGCGGIIDPVSMPTSAIAELDEQSEPFKLAKAVLTGQDAFGGEYIAAFREGRFKE
jgi:5-methyltetrahydrofolate--homocysteine methyltransferase